jgi:hypothetical protein
MSIQKQLRDMQDRLRNAGWHIQWIPWQPPDTPEYIHSKNPLPLIGVTLFLGAIFLSGRRIGDITISVNMTIISTVAGLALAMVGIMYVAHQRQAGWERVDARCIGREIEKCEDADQSVTWVYRLVCVFTYQGQEYTVTPEPSYLMGFRSDHMVQEYLRKHIQPDGRCQLWIDPRNPLHAIFHKKRWWI